MKTALVLGSSGRFGRNMVNALEARGWAVRGFRRGHDTLENAARGVDVIVNSWNPPYHRWAREVPALHGQVQRVAKANGATVLIPGNVYGFGNQTQMPWRETTPQIASGGLGRIRLEMERAYEAEGVRTIVLRSGDFIDTEASGNWMDKVILRQVSKDKIIWPGDPEVSHSWAFLPDVARAAVDLIEARDHLERFSVVHFPGYTLSGREIANLAAQAVGKPLAVRRMSWLPIQLMRPFWPVARHLIEMRYLWSLPHELASDRFDNLFPEFQSTPPEVALAAAVAAVSGSSTSTHTSPWRPASGPVGQTMPELRTVKLDAGSA